MASIIPPTAATDAFAALGAAPGSGSDPAAAPGDGSLVIIESLLCLMREKNLLSRADVEELCRKVDRRATGESKSPLPCCAQAAHGASGMMHRLTTYLGQRYGGKHGRH